MPPPWPSYVFLYIYIKQNISFNLGLIVLARLVGYWTPGINLCLYIAFCPPPPIHTQSKRQRARVTIAVMLVFSWLGNWNADPHFFTVNNLLAYSLLCPQNVWFGAIYIIFNTFKEKCTNKVAVVRRNK